jgi:tRNA uridine 5-carbamoylmethylation protein Kti12
MDNIFKNGALILIDGGPASGKNTLGKLLVKRFEKKDNRAVLIDLDPLVEELNPSWIWDSKEEEKNDKNKARGEFINKINDYLSKNFTVLAIGEKFLNKAYLDEFLTNINGGVTTYLFHLSAPLDLRKKRLEERGPDSLIDLEKDQRERDAVVEWPGMNYENVNTPEVDAENLFQMIKSGTGVVSSN